MNARPGDMEVTMKLTRAQERTFYVGIALCMGLAFGIGFAVGVFYVGAR